MLLTVLRTRTSLLASSMAWLSCRNYSWKNWKWRRTKKNTGMREKIDNDGVCGEKRRLREIPYTNVEHIKLLGAFL
jgi:hypothetical protein